MRDRKWPPRKKVLEAQQPSKNDGNENFQGQSNKENHEKDKGENATVVKYREWGAGRGRDIPCGTHWTICSIWKTPWIPTC